MDQKEDLLAAIPAAPSDGDPLEATRPCPNVLRSLALRRSTLAREMTEPGPSDAEIEALVRLAARVPDHGKLGPWRFLIFKGKAREEFGDKIAEIFLRNEPNADETRIEFERQRLLRAPVVIAVISKTQPHPKAPEWEQILSCGAACQNLLIATFASGYAAQWITEWIAYDDDVNDLLELTEGERVAGYIYIGTASTQPTERRRVDLQERIAYWGS